MTENQVVNLPSIEGVNFRLIPYHLGYAVGDDGSIWTLRKRGSDSSGTWRKVKATKHPFGHSKIMLREQGKRSSLYVHRLVLLCFVGEPPLGFECCHNNGNPSDNRLSNLRWGSRSDNVKDAIQHGTIVDFLPGERHFLAKVTEKDVIEIRSIFNRNSKEYCASALSKKYKISRRAIMFIVNRQTWTHI